MSKTLKTTLGFYSPSFMHLHVGGSFEPSKIGVIHDDYSESIYLHEYTHFIQDISTTYGYTNINIFADYMRMANNKVTASSPGGFKVPVDPVPGAADNVYAGLKLHELYNGSGDALAITIKNYKETMKPVVLDVGSRNFPVIELTYSIPGSRKLKTFEFGALCVMESMAFLLERACYPASPTSPDLPYRSAEKLAQLLHPAFAKNPLNILALCDVALRDFHPGSFFFDTLYLLKRNKMVPGSPEEVYDFANKHHKPFKFGTASNLDELFSFSGNQAINQLGKYFYDPQFDPIKNWLENIIRKSMEYRFKNPTFTIDIARSGPIAGNKPLADFMNAAGTPLITNDLNQLYLFDPNSYTTEPNYPLIWAVDQIMEVLLADQKNCDLIGYCKSVRAPTDTRCHHSPWDRANDPPPWCPFAIMWRHWAMAGHYPIDEQNSNSVL